jgi:hypothetical protein
MIDFLDIFLVVWENRLNQVEMKNYWSKHWILNLSKLCTFSTQAS